MPHGRGTAVIAGSATAKFSEEVRHPPSWRTASAAIPSSWRADSNRSAGTMMIRYSRDHSVVLRRPPSARTASESTSNSLVAVASRNRHRRSHSQSYRRTTMLVCCEPDTAAPQPKNGCLMAKSGFCGWHPGGPSNTIDGQMEPGRVHDGKAGQYIDVGIDGVVSVAGRGKQVTERKDGKHNGR